jgi:hypothetical protein
MKWKRRLFWVGGLILLWLLCSGVAQAAPLTERLEQFPNWQGKPPAQAARGDLVYPEWFAGNWQVTTTLVDMAAPLAPEITTPGFEGNRQYLNQPVTFQVRFMETPSSKIFASLPLALPLASLPLPSWFSNGQKQIVSDRAFNGLSLAKAYLGDRAVLAVKVDPDNPNRQITLLRGEAPEGPRERQLVSTVTARATESPTPDQFVTTEVFQQEFRGTPQLYFNEVENTTAYTRQPSRFSSDNPAIIADQVTAIYLSPQDPNYFKAIATPLGEPHPVTLYRYRMEFRKDEEQN